MTRKRPPGSRDCKVPSKKPKIPQATPSLSSGNLTPHGSQQQFQPSPQAKKAGCNDCKRYEAKSRLVRHVILEVSLEELLPSSKKAKRKETDKNTPIHKLFETVNGFLNTKGGGVVIIHAASLDKIDQLYQKIDVQLLGMIPPNAFYHDYFECHFLDPSHCAFRVKTKPGNQLSTLDYKTKLSTNRGIVDPSYCQMVETVKLVSLPEPQEEGTGVQSVSPSKENKEVIKFISEKEVKIVKTNGLGDPEEIPFHESMTRQVKRLDKIQKLAEDCWKYSHEYIPAFSRILKGGSVYIGVSEEKTMEPKWTDVTEQQNTAQIVSINPHNSEWKVWAAITDIDDEEINMLYVTRDPQYKETSTGKLIAKGIPMSDQTQQSVKQFILNKVKSDMIWIGKSQPRKPIEVKFHRVEQQPSQPTSSQQTVNEKFIIEVKVNYYHGICFYCRSGPELYRFLDSSGTKPAPIPCTKWLEKFISDILASKSPAKREESNSLSFSAGTSASAQKPCSDLRIFYDVLI